MILIKPHYLDSERAYIKCILEDQDALWEIKNAVTSKMFYGVDNLIVYGHIENVLEAGGTLDVTVLRARLENSEEFDLVGGEKYFENIFSVDTLQSNLAEYAKNIKDAFIRRELISTDESIKTAG